MMASTRPMNSGPKTSASASARSEAVLDLVGGVAVVHGNGHRAGLENPEVDGQPFQAVHEQDGDLGALADASGKKEVGEAVGRSVELPPGHLPARVLEGVGLHEFVLTPGDFALVLDLGIDADEADLVAVELGVPREYLGDEHRSCPPAISGGKAGRSGAVPAACRQGRQVTPQRPALGRAAGRLYPAVAAS